jgi:predicted dehydrogenase
MSTGHTGGGTRITSRVRVGVIGCGRISDVYLENARRFGFFDVIACSDIDMERAGLQAERHGIPRACGVEELLADPEIEIVLNLTVPDAHAEVSLVALESGKSVYSEKPLAVSLADGRRILEEARSRGLLVGCAPDTFLGGALQTARKLMDDGAIGSPVAAEAAMLNRGNEHIHPDPTFRYQPGTGPLLDMGPYYLTALAALVGPVRRVTASARVTFPERVITSRTNYGARIQVNTPTHVAGVLDFECGAVATFVSSFDVWAEQARIEVHGTGGSLSLPDPNAFDGPVRVRLAGDDGWSEVPLTHGYTENCRGLGLADMALALRSGRPHRANGEVSYHVLEMMHALYEASSEERHVEVASTCDRPVALPAGGTLEE